MTQTASFSAPDGTSLKYRYWCASSPRASLVLLHGWGNHSGRFDGLARALSESGLACFAPDFLGHGLSPGPRAQVHDFGDLLAQLNAFLRQVSMPGPVFLLGQSMGGALGAHYAIQCPDKIGGVIFSGAALAVNRKVALWKRLTSRLLGRLWPQLPVGVLRQAHHMTRCPREIERYLTDDLVHHGSIDAGTGRCLLLANHWLERHGQDLETPFLALQGTEDELVAPCGPERLKRAAPRAAGTVVHFPAARHDLIHDLGVDAVSEPIEAWLAEQLGQRSAEVEHV